MAKATRFDLSQLEGCTGTVSDTPVAMPRALRPARPTDAQDRAKRVGADAATPPAPTAPSTSSTAPSALPAQTEPSESAAAPEAPDAAPAQRLASTNDDAAAAPAAPAPVPAPRRSVFDLENDRRARELDRADDSESLDRVRLGVILALTLSAWIPVLLIWWARLG
ncbi:MAG: hypothetical protein FJ253_00060 [Phycisphaerae bacterium]|nr:hypothetical protein [Phycisphaerae bacterium]